MHHTSERTWFITFTCHQWIPLFEITNSYDLIYDWLNLIKEKLYVRIVAFVIMPNHVHLLLHLPENTDLNKMVSNGKRFIAYEIIKRLKVSENSSILFKLQQDCSLKERSKGQLHKVFEPSFDAKPLFTDKFLHQKLDYIHYNPVSGKWNLASTFFEYPHSSAGFYEHHLAHPFIDICHYKDLDG